MHQNVYNQPIYTSTITWYSIYQPQQHISTGVRQPLWGLRSQQPGYLEKKTNKLYANVIDYFEFSPSLTKYELLYDPFSGLMEASHPF